MLSFTGSLKVYLATEAADLRKSFTGLYALTTQVMGEDPLTGSLFVFCNRRRSRVKVLYWDGTGLWVACKRLEEGRFSWPQPSREGQKSLSLTPQALAMLTDGIELKGARMRPWYEREEK